MTLTTTEAPPAAATFTPKTATRQKGTYLACATPDEFFSNRKFVEKFAADIGRRWERRTGFMHAKDVGQDGLLMAVKCAQRWTPAMGVPFGGYAWSSAMLWMRSESYRQAVPVTGTFNCLADVQGIGFVSLDQAVPGSEEGASYGELLAWEDTDTGVTTSPDAVLLADSIHTAVEELFAGVDPEVTDAVLSELHGTPVDPTELPSGYTAQGVRVEAARIRMRAAGELAAVLGWKAPPAAAAATMATVARVRDASDPWLALDRA